MSTPFPIPLNALRAIEIVARTGALGPAAKELGVTIGAVSQHIRRAEERLGMVLFTRSSTGLKPSQALTAIQPQLQAGFRGLADAVASLKGEAANTLTVTAGSVFASLFLVPRFGRFAALYPDIELRLLATPKFVDLGRPDVDCAIRFGADNWPGVVTNQIGDRRYGAYCAPEMATRLRSPEQFGTVPVIHDETSLLSWPRWLEAAGLAGAGPFDGPSFSDPVLAYQAAVCGQGVLLVMNQLAQSAVTAGQLVPLFSVTVVSEFAYFFATGAGRRLPPRVRQFRAWLDEEMGAGT
ncbi:MAG: Glycine cleavage system transcriptional activator [Hyphomicrobiales bacterium]|nr:Glycine cleavage system transcriptional activator [Hyphomicrobiales bacterium]